MGTRFVFDQPHYDALNSAREKTLRELLGSLRASLELRRAVDVGCGLGHFSDFLRALDFRVLGVDGREQNVAEAARRYPEIEFKTVDAENERIQSFGGFDLVLCMGLLYHLENPFIAVRNLFAMTSKVAILEGMCLPGNQAVLGVRDEGPTEDQGLRHVALYPTENGLIKLLYRSGFPFVYRFREQPPHADYSTSSLRKKVRMILVASTLPLETNLLAAAPEPVTNPDPWEVKTSAVALVRAAGHTAKRLWRFAAQPWPEKQRILHRRWTRIFPG